MSVESRLFDARVRIVTGKGGVGKSTVALALALIAQRHGRRVLLCETNPPESVSRFLGMEPLTGDPRRIGPGLDMCALIPAEAIREYALMILKFRALYNAVFENRIVRYFLRAVPSLGEFVMLGKLWFHERERDDDGRFRWDTIIVDAPATGHLLSWLRVPHVFVEMMPTGPLQSSSRDFLEMLQDPARAKLDVVTLPEEMPVNEAIEIDRAATEQRLCTRGLTVVNRVMQPMPAGLVARCQPAVDAAAAAHAPALREMLATVAAREHWRTLGDKYLRRLPADELHEALQLGRRQPPVTGRAVFDAIARELEAQL